MRYTTILNAFKDKCKLDGFNILSGHGLSYQDFEQGKAIEIGSVTAKTICISLDGYMPFGVNEDSTHSRLSAFVSVIIKSNIDIDSYLLELIENINSDNRITTLEGTYLIELTGANPITMEKNNYVYQIDYSVN